MSLALILRAPVTVAWPVHFHAPMRPPAAAVGYHAPMPQATGESRVRGGNGEPLIDIRLVDGPVDAVPFDPFPQPAGAECVFLGRTRCETHPEHGDLTELSYEAYQPLAESTLEELARVAADQYECIAVRIHHAVGVVPPGAASVVVQVVCGHRGASFDACRFLIDRLKQVTPIWKREVWADGTSWSTGQAVEVDGPEDSSEES